MDEIGDMTFPQANLIVAKHFERYAWNFKMISQFLGGDGESGDSSDIAQQANGGSPVRVLDDPYPDGFERM